MLKKRVWCAINNTKEETNMTVLAVPMDKTFEVAVDKVENFDKKQKSIPENIFFRIG